jgi:glycosyltransferase involved in cell wall biosynthesis
MKIIYIFASPSLRGSSVQIKVLNQIKYLNKAGADCRGAFFSTEVKEITPLNEYVELIPVEKCIWKYFRIIGQRKNLDKKIFSFIKTHHQEVDLFYVRYYGSSKKLAEIGDEFGDKIVSEHQSKELDEIKSGAHLNPFGLKLSNLLSWYLYNYRPIHSERKWGVKFVKKIRSVVTITNELSNYHKKKGAKNVVVSANGIAVNDFQTIQSQEVKSPIRILFLKGTSTNAAWNGIERLIKSIDQYNFDNKNIQLVICGHYIEGEISQRDYIQHLGYLNKEELDKLINSIHIGVSTLALYKKNLEQAAVLKTREYIARGLPFIYAYTDPDLNEESKEFALVFPNDDSLIDMEKVIEFAQKVLSDIELPQKMRKYAEEHLDYEVKMKKLYQELLKL